MLELHVRSDQLPPIPQQPPHVEEGRLVRVQVPDYPIVTLRATASTSMKVRGLQSEIQAPQDWLVSDIRANEQSWFKPGTTPIPGDLFSVASLIGRFVEFGTLREGDVVEVDVTNVGYAPAVYVAAFGGNAL